jgi:hypothetical protein
LIANEAPSAIGSISKAPDESKTPIPDTEQLRLL